ncbi:MAG TPA: Zn-ribbon containing protein [Candidatus Brocadiaceae bacterium]
MPHQCVHCSNIIPMGSKEVLEGCGNCGGHFFFYVKDEQLNMIKEMPEIEIPQNEKKKVEADIRDMAGIPDEGSPVILDIESIRVFGEGKYELDLVNLFSNRKPIVYKLEEGKYIIDLSSLREGVKKEEE